MASGFKIWWARRELASAVREFVARVDSFDCNYDLATYLCPPLPEMRTRCESMHARLRQIDRKCSEDLWQNNLRSHPIAP